MDEVTKKLSGEKNHSRNCLILHIRTLTFHGHVRKIYFNSLLIQKGVTFAYYNLGLLTKIRKWARQQSVRAYLHHWNT